MKKIASVAITCFAFLLGFVQAVFPGMKKECGGTDMEINRDTKAGSIGTTIAPDLKEIDLEGTGKSGDNPTVEGENLKFEDLEKIGEGLKADELGKNVKFDDLELEATTGEDLKSYEPGENVKFDDLEREEGSKIKPEDWKR